MNMQTVGIVGLGALGVLFGQRLLENGADVRVIADEARGKISKAGRYLQRHACELSI